MRNRTWRKWREEVVYKRKLKRYKIWSYIGFTGNNSIWIKNPKWSDVIGSENLYIYRSISTHKNDSRWKIKYSSNKTHNYLRDIKVSKDSLGTRERDRLEFLKIKMDYGV